ncbi:hypothetical protein OPV22_033875 [Ensete ventricosum]|uniref:Uncharacterized protein n=1 Tax=Ensete ventricosum TaxID=4639 RepID=A0AAV8Q378_ENSVE|nr:hypothetical protein OPV22_033875 [Ensete ventricosum]
MAIGADNSSPTAEKAQAKATSFTLSLKRKPYGHEILGACLLGPLQPTLPHEAENKRKRDPEMNNVKQMVRKFAPLASPSKSRTGKMKQLQFMVVSGQAYPNRRVPYVGDGGNNCWLLLSEKEVINSPLVSWTSS